MGMYDESWCASCGAGMHYTEDEDAECGACAQDAPDKLIELIEYIKIHRISLIQDNANLIQDTDAADWNFLQGQIIGVEHILSVATDIMLSTREEDE